MYNDFYLYNFSKIHIRSTTLKKYLYVQQYHISQITRNIYFQSIQKSNLHYKIIIQQLKKMRSSNPQVFKPYNRVNIQEKNRDVKENKQLQEHRQSVKPLISSYLKNFKKNHIKPTQLEASYNSNNSIGSKGKTKTMVDEQNEDNIHFHHFMNETDNSMQQVLNSSINQFERYLMQQNNRQITLQQQNNYLRNTLQKLKVILREKLQSALKKQKDQLSKMLEDYISLITKLLKDKEELTIALHDMQKQHNQIEQQIQEQFDHKLKNAMRERDQQITLAKQQIDDFLEVINQYEEDAKLQNDKFEMMQARIQELQQQKGSKETSIKLQAQSTKIQTLLELLQKSQQQNYQLRQQLKKRQHTGPIDLREHYQSRFRQLQTQHQEQFLEYQRAIKQTLTKKDECIKRLSLIIQGLRGKPNDSSPNKA